MKVNDENFISLLRKRKECSLDYVMNNYGGLVKAVVSKNLYNLQSLHDECINDIFMAIWSNIHSYDENRSQFKNWVVGIAKYKCIDFQRKYLRELENENIEDLNIEVPDNTSADLIKHELDSNIEKLLSCLKEEDRELFINIFVKGMDIEEVVEKTGLKRENIYNRISKGKKKIKLNEKNFCSKGGIL
ncbi:MAG: sigma-70 family RNA polymerase sigma factor [Clostridium sp.]